jgi:geranylgeranyl diphosphate synthase type II
VPADALRNGGSGADIASVLEREREKVEGALDRHLPDPGEYPERIHEAIRYSTLDGGKRLRPIVALSAAEALGYDSSRVLPVACAMEYVHCCSLVLDDLPSMDNAIVRRGRPTTHRAFGVATAILAADALLMHAFRLVADNGVEVGADGARMARAVRELATAVGSFGMVGGQHVDLEVAARETVDHDTLEYIQSRKTGALFVVSARIGGVLLGAPEDGLARLSVYARDLGLAYQIVDDLLDAEGDPLVIGKDVGKDARKKTFVTVYGAAKARDTVRRLVGTAEAALTELPRDAWLLRGIAEYCASRTL